MKAGLLVAVVAVASGFAVADSFCFSTAETYYEQVYCEVQSRGGQLPPLYEFRRNPEMTQALLLKRPAAKLGIDLVMPRNKVAAGADRLSSAPPGKQKSGRANRGPLADCHAQGRAITCPGRHFALVENRNNSHLKPGALDPGDRLGLPDFKGSTADGDAVARYLDRSYRRYIDKMLQIGLGGATMPFSKFDYLFRSTTGMGIDFARRAEIMFRFLKQDKRNNAVGGSSPVPVIDLADCRVVREQLLACETGSRNYLYLSP